MGPTFRSAFDYMFVPMIIFFLYRQISLRSLGFLMVDFEGRRDLRRGNFFFFFFFKGGRRKAIVSTYSEQILDRLTGGRSFFVRRDLQRIKKVVERVRVDWMGLVWLPVI